MKGIAEAIMSHMSPLPDEHEMEKEGETDEYETVAAEIILACHTDDKEGLAKALKNFFLMCDAMPHEEGPVG